MLPSLLLLLQGLILYLILLFLPQELLEVHNSLRSRIAKGEEQGQPPVSNIRILVSIFSVTTPVDATYISLTEGVEH